MALVPSIPQFLTPPTRAVIPPLSHKSDTMAFEVIQAF